ncbi:MAG: radical SAM protein [Bacilli bacterium]|nr:radical SAM protein [Bacilli bacterium]NLC88389.1 radical SAM protein [Clostridiaceae bacterium]
MERVPSLIVLNLTSDCNLRCKYCYASAGTFKEYMTSECAIEIIRQVAKYNNTIELLFHGGEPLLVFDVIKEVIDYCKNNLKSKEIRYYIQTNGVLLTAEKAKYLIDENVEICLSIDGHTETSNQCRIYPAGQSSLKMLKNRIDLLKSMNYNTTVLAVLNKKNKNEIEDFIDFLINNKIFNFSLNYFIKGGRGNENSDLALSPVELYEVTKNVISKILSYHEKNIKVVERNISHLLRNIFTEKKGYMCMNSPCGAGNHLLGYTPNGDIYPCDDLSSVEQFKIGNIFDGDIKDILKDNDVINFFNYCSYENIPKCCDCKIKNKCGAGCASRKFYENGTIYEVDPICEFYKLIVPYIENLMIENPSIKELV